MSPISRGFHDRRQDPAANAGRVPPGQYATKDFPVLSAGPTPRTALPLTCACGPASFAEAAAQALAQSGYPPRRVKTERFGATGGTTGGT
jgi:hypothetical protein